MKKFDTIQKILDWKGNILIDKKSLSNPAKKLQYMHGDNPRCMESLRPEFERMFFRPSPFRGFKVPTCAVVGSSSCLLDTEYGDEIDDSDFVLRFGFARTQGFEKHVGGKTDARIMGKSWIFQEFNELVLRRYHTAKYAVQDSRNPSNPEFYAFDFDFCNQYCNMAYRSFNQENPEHGRYITTSGFLGVMLALQIAEKVTIYGFSVPRKDEAPYHYFPGRVNKQFKFRSSLKKHPWNTEYYLYEQFSQTERLVWKK